MLKRQACSSQPPLSYTHSPSSSTAQLKAKASKNACTSLAAAQSRILHLSLLIRLLSLFLLLLASHLQQPFDTSHQLLSFSLDPSTAHLLSSGPFHWLLSFVRWDTIHFLSSASPYNAPQHIGGYRWEQTLAFQPEIIALLRVTGYVTPSMDGSWSPTSAILLTTILANLATLVAPVLLFRLSLRVTGDAKLAESAAMLSILAPAAGTTLSCPTPEPFFSLASLVGMLALENSNQAGQIRWRSLVAASLSFAVAAAFRANGTLLVGYIAFALLRAARVENAILLLLKLMVGGAVCVAPNVLFQVWAYTRFCLSGKSRPWCEGRLPSIYSFVQSHYWNVGFLRYWQLSQLPNFALAAPVLLAIAYTVFAYYRTSTPREIGFSLNPLASPLASKKEAERLGLSSAAKAVPYVVHGLVLGLVLLFASHVQIALRLATPGGMPMVWWGAAHAVVQSKRWRKVVVGYLAVQYGVGIVLYAGFYPPA